MKTMSRLFIVSAVALLIAAPAAFAQTPEASTLTVETPLLVGSTILQPGAYLIRVVPTQSSREQIQITDPDRTKVFATVLTVPHQLKAGEDITNTTFVYYPAADGTPAALRTWFAPHPFASGGGHDIVYEESRAKELARLSNSSVVAYQAETADISTAPLSVISPQGTIETYTIPAPSPTIAETPAMTSGTTEVAESTPTEMPRTASNIPLMALLGLASIGAAVAFRFGRG